MATGTGHSVFLNRGGKANGSPCPTNLVFLSNQTEGNTIISKLDGSVAPYIESNCKYYNGVDAYSEVINVIVSDTDYLTINYSIDGDDWSNTFDSRTDTNDGYYNINGNNLTIGTNGVVFKEFYCGLISGYDSEGNLIYQFTMASGSNNVDVSRILLD